MPKDLTPQEAVEAIMSNLKILLPNYDDSKDNIYLLYTNKLVCDILVYCHRCDFPKPLVYTCVELIKKRIDDDVAAEAGTKGLKSVKMDDTEFQFNTAAAVSAGNQSELDFNSIRPRLNLFRKLRGYPP